MQMNDIIDGLGSCEYAPVSQGCGNNIGNCGGFGNYGGGFGSCGFGWWIWILLILFYSNQGNGGCVSNNNCCCNNDCCCNSGCGGYGGIFNGGGTNCGTWLFLLVILFLCGNCGNNGYGNGFGCGGDCLGLGQGYDGLFGGCC